MSERPESDPQRPAGALLTLDGLWLRRGGRELFAGLGLELEQGQLLAVSGPNGSGKTTLLRVLGGLQGMDRGALRWRGAEFEARLDEPGQALLYLGDRPGLARDLSVLENLEYHAALSAAPAERVGDALATFALTALAGQAVRKLSTGQIKRTALARLLVSRARVWLLDEPFNGLDSDSRETLCAAIASHLAADGVAAIVSHDPYQVPGCAPRPLRLAL